jgi:hypothetical protein
MARFLHISARLPGALCASATLVGCLAAFAPRLLSADACFDSGMLATPKPLSRLAQGYTD